MARESLSHGTPPSGSARMATGPTSWTSLRRCRPSSSTTTADDSVAEAATESLRNAPPMRSASRTAHSSTWTSSTPSRRRRTMPLSVPEDKSITGSGYYNSHYGDARSLMERIQRMFETDMPLEDSANPYADGTHYKITVTVEEV